VKRTIALLLALCGTLAVPALAAAKVYFHDVDFHNVVKPKTLFLTGDGTLEVQNVSWSSWGGATATGSGSAEHHGCTPSCAQGTVHHDHVTITLSKIKTCGSKRYYAHVALRLNSGKLLDKSLLSGRNWAPC
jgi:hypothetical protein